MIALLALLSLSADPIRLRGLVATSGAGVEAVLDGNDVKGWLPPGRAAKEGITFSFEQPTKVGKVQIVPCAVTQTGSATLYCDGSYRAMRTGMWASCDAEVKTVFVQLATDGYCVGEVRFFSDASTPLAVQPPRTVNAKIEASSTLAPQEAFHPSFLVDGRLDFGWAEGAKGTGEKESVTFTFDAPQTVTAIEVWNGYQRSPDHFQKNARVKTLTLGGETVALEDKDGPQKVTLAKPVSGVALTLTVTAVYPGKKYPDLVLSELRFFDAQGPFVPRTTYREEHQQQLLATHKATPAGTVIDAPLSTFCSQSNGSLKLRSNASFIADFEQSTGDATTERTEKRVIEGAWVASDTLGAMLTFDIYAKQYVSRSTYRQYGKNSFKDSIGIIGGKHKLYDFAKMDDAAFTALVESWKQAKQESLVACTTEHTRADLAKRKIVFIGGPVFNDFFAVQ